MAESSASHPQQHHHHHPPPSPPALSSSPPGDEPGPLPPPSITHRVFHPPKLERKHSSGDLHSRLKTRKILGVGETDNGDVHRSKISQLLGHNEHLYVKFPRGFWVWHLFMAILLTVQGFFSLVLPEKAFSSSLDPQALFAARLHGAALLGVSTFLWNFQGTTDKAQARCTLLAIMLYHCLYLAVCLLSAEGNWFHQVDVVASVVCQGVLFAINFLYHQAIGRSTSGLRKSSSYKDLSSAALTDKKDFSRDDSKKETGKNGK